MNNQIKFPDFVSFITSPAGRTARIVAGLALIGAGTMASNRAGYVVAALGIVPLFAGAFDVCILGRLLGGPYNGDLMRQALHTQKNQPELGTKSSSFMKA